MYIKQLEILENQKQIRCIHFHEGLNLIVDETKDNNLLTITGNNVGKTTVLKLISFCFGEQAREIYTSSENTKDEYQLVKDFLVDHSILVRLTLKEDLNDLNSNEILIERNFKQRKEIVRRINGKDYLENEFEMELRRLLFKDLRQNLLSLKQLIAHNIRYKDYAINNTIKYLNPYTKDTEYETLFLYLLGLDYSIVKDKDLLSTKLKQEQKYLQRLQADRTKNNYQMMIDAIDYEIDQLNVRKDKLNINENFQNDLTTLNEIKFNINQITENLSLLEMRKELICESKEELKRSRLDIDIDELEYIYEESKQLINNLDKRFDDLVQFHNTMIENKMAYINKELPDLEEKMNLCKQELNKLLEKEKEYTELLKKQDTLSDLQTIVSEINKLYQKKGTYKGNVEKIEESEKEIIQIQKQIDLKNNLITSSNYQDKVKNQVIKFNRYFEKIAYYLYGEKYLLSYELKKNRQGQSYYSFNTFNENLSSGKKQGEILCFDIALIEFLRDLGRQPLCFLLNDKKELMDNNQLIKVSKYAKEHGIQLIFPMLLDKVPSTLKNDDYIILYLSQKDKLFRIKDTIY